MTRDLRRYQRQTTFRLLVGFIAILFLIGDGLVYLFYGRQAAVMGLLCMLAGLAPLVIVWILLSVMGWLVRMANQDN